MPIEIRPYTSDDFDGVSLLLSDAFRRPLDDAVWSDGGWVLIENGRVRATMLLHRAGQFFGGRSLSVGLVRSVAVAPEARGKGFGRRLMTGVLEALREDG